MGESSTSSECSNGGWVIQTERDKDVKSSSSFREKVNSVFRTIFHGWVKVEVIMQLKLATPIILSLVLQNFLLFITLLFVGQINRSRSLEIDSAALASSFANITGISVGIGLSTAADTLCSQAYGFKNYRRVGYIFQRGLIILLLLSFFIWCIWLNTESLLLLVQQSPCVARFGGQYIQIMTLALPPYFLYLMLQKYFQSQSVVWPFIIASFLTNIACVIFHCIFVLWAKLGVNGASLSMVLSYCCLPIFLIVYVRIRKLHALTWDGWSWESLKEWWQFLKLGIAGVALTCLEWISYEIAAFVLGSISEVELAANSIIVNILMIVYMVPLGISIASGIRIGNELGAGNPKQAKRSTIISVIATVINTVIQFILLQSTKSVIGLMYTTDSEVIARIPSLVNVISVLLFGDQLQLSLRGVLLGCGHQLFGAVVNFIAFYIVGLPLGIALALRTDLGSVGMWVGLLVACYLQTFCFIVYIFRLDWKKESEKAIIRSCGNNYIQEVEQEVMEEEVEHDLEDERLSDDVTISDTVHLLTVSSDEQESYSLHENEKLEEIELKDITTSEGEVELLNEDNEEFITSHDSLLLTDDVKEPHTSSRGSNIKIFLCKFSLFLIASVCVICAGIVSQFHPPESIMNGNYSECTDVDLFDIEPSSTLYIYPTSIPYY